jgi:ribosomal protein RSM22 (predicted rRNA methylase)
MIMLRFVLALTFLTFPRCGAMTFMLKRVKEKYPDFHPNAIIDVGANAGDWR